MTLRFTQFIFLTVILLSMSSRLYPATISGELKKWHKVELLFNFNNTSEQASTNPFTDYRLNVTFTNGTKTYVVPGHYAADGNAAETSNSAGSYWRAYFVPDEVGTWTYQVSFRTGTNVSVDLNPNAGTPVAPHNGLSGNFSIQPSDKTGDDFRAKGMLRYVGGHYLQFAENGEYFLKGGADSPENFLGYYEFDQTFDLGGKDAPGLVNGLHQYGPHVGHWNRSDPKWQGSKGKGIIGALNYLASKGINSVYFLTYNIDGGDGMDTWVWTDPGERQRFDVSKLDQWEIVFSQMDKLGIQLHLVTQETENDGALGGSTSLIRRVYYRELVSRFSHHLAVQWNIGEENNNSDSDRAAFANYLRTLDPYDHPITVHTYNNAASTFYNGILNNNSYLQYFETTSIQGGADSYNSWAVNLRNLSASKGKKWAIYGDEQGPMVNPEPGYNDNIRREALWGNLMGGGAGIEWYFGYQGTFGDLQSEDWTVTEELWEQTAYALDFFQTHVPFHEMTPNNGLLSSGTNDRCFAKAGEYYVIQLRYGGSGVTTTLDINSPGTYTVRWFNPRTGEGLLNGTVTHVASGTDVDLGDNPAGDSEDWIILVTNSTDCAGVSNGDAFVDDCGICSGGTTGVTPNGNKDCSGVCFGNAYLDDCGNCISADCPCIGGITELIILYEGNSGVTINLFSQASIRSSSLITSSTNVSNGDTLYIDASSLSNGILPGTSYFHIEGTAKSSKVGLNTSCSEQLLNRTFESYTVIRYTDSEGNSCPVPSSCVDCHGDLNGSAFIDDCGICAGGNTGLSPNANQDDCGVCFGNNAAKDCNGDCFGAAYIDDCGVCAAGNTGIIPCVADCNGDPGGTALLDKCGICSGGNSGHIANSDLDDCGICFGNNSNQDCNGDCFGDAYIDNCGNCVGGYTGLIPCEVDCNGDPGGTAFIDNCGICSGGNSGHIANSDIDDCGICFGNNSNKDCNGDCFVDAYIDNCGNCVGGNTGSGPCVVDCNGDPEGIAFLDNCGVCSGGNSGHIANSDIDDCGVCFGNNSNKDCNGDCFGSASIDNCDICSGGNTGIAPNSTCAQPCAQLEVVSFTLMHAGTDGPISLLTNGTVINKAAIGSFSIRADVCQTPVGSVKFILNNSTIRTESAAPYAIYGDSPAGNYIAWNPSVGSYTLTGIPYSGSGGSGTQGISETVSFTVIDQQAPQCASANDCNDGSPCTLDACESGACVSTAVNTDDGNACTTDACNPTTGSVTHTPIGCDDGDDCTADECSDGICGHTPIAGCGDLCWGINCDDADECTTDWCSEAICQHSPIAGCGDPCAGINCDDGDECTIDWCSDGICEHTVIAACGNLCNNLVCDDKDACTSDICDSLLGCLFVPINSEPSYLRVINSGVSWKKLRMGYDPASLWSPKQDVIAGGNDVVCITLSTPTSGVRWDKLQIRPHGSSSYIAVLDDYLPQGGIGASPTEICIPLSAFGSADFTKISLIEIPYSSGADAFELHIQKIEFRGGSKPFLWFGDSKTNNYHDGQSGSGSALYAELVPGTPCDAEASAKRTASDNNGADEETLFRAYPNPLKDKVIIDLKLKDDQRVRLDVIAPDGRKIASLYEGSLTANQTCKIEWQAVNLSSGIYFFRLITENGEIYNNKFIVIR